MDFKKLKKSNDVLQRLSAEIDKQAKGTQNNSDDRFWRPVQDKAGNGFAIIRFLPAPAVDGDEGRPWIKRFTHGFKGPTGKWYIENSLTTIGQPDPVSELNSALWNSGNEADKEVARAQKRKLVYTSNIQVLKHPARPEDEGKIFLFNYGKKIFDKISQKMHPELEDEEAMNAFDFWTGANFRLKVKKVAQFPNYDDSSFDNSTALNSDDSELEKLWKSEHSLLALLNPDQFKSYEELKRRLEYVLDKAMPTTKAPVKETVIDSTSSETTPPFETGDTADDEEWFNNLMKKRV